MSHLKVWLGGVAALSLVAVASSAAAGGFAAPEISVEGLGRANSGEAAATGAASQWWNPAAIARSPREIALGASHRWTATKLIDNGSTITRPIAPGGFTTPVGGASTVDDGYADFTAVDGAGALPVSDKIVLGLSVTHPFRLKGDFGTDAFGRYDTVRNRIDVTDVQGTVAVAASDWLDLGFGIDSQRMQAGLDTASPNLIPGTADGLQSLGGHGWNYGWTVGAQAHLEQLSFGLSYRSTVHHDLQGSLSLTGLTAPLDTANFTAPAETRFNTPWSLAAAVRYAINPALTLEGQVVRTGWSKYDAIGIAFAGSSAAIPQDYKDTTSVAVGADYKLTGGWTVRGGVQYDPTPTPDDRREPGVADSDRWVYAVGTSVALSDTATVHAALAYTDYQGADIHLDTGFYAGTAAFTTAALRGRFEGHSTTGAVGLDFRF
jgi:long-chain fatty acid transport protein